jgi:hypothetical protein
MALAFSASGAHAQTFSKPMKLSNTSGSSASQVVVDSNGHIDAVWEDGACGIWFSRSADSGATFSAPVSVATATNCSQDERIAVDPQGNISVVWSSSSIVSTIYFARSTDGGNTFSTPANISQSIPAANYPAMALAADGSINVEWIGFSPRSIFLSRSENGGGSFSTTTIWNLPVQSESGASDGRIAARADGSVYAVWYYASDTGVPDCDILFSRSTDRGVTFANPTNLSHSPRCATLPQMAIDSSGNIDIVWNEGPSGLRFSQSTDGGNNFSAPTAIPQSGGLAQMAVDVKGNINVVWNSSSFLSSDVMFTRSVNGGANFSSPKDLGPGGGQIAVDSAGNIEILVQGPYANGHDDIFYTRSTDDGSNFSTPANVSNNSGQAELSQMAVEANGDIDIVWDDNGSGSSVQDTSVYFRRAVVSQPIGDFTISAAPASLVPLPGGSATTQITMTATGGFNQAVNLSCSKLTTGAACSFDPASVTPSASGAHANLTLTIPPTMTQGTFAFTISAASGNATHTQDVQVTVGGLSGLVAPAAMTIAAGSASNFTVTVNSAGGFSGPVSLACSGAPAGVACSFSPPQFNVQANAAATSTLTVQVATKPSGSLSHRNPATGFPGARNFVAISGLLLLMAWARARSVNGSRAAIARALGAIVLTIALAAAMVSCGGVTSTTTSGGTSSPGGTGGSGSAGGTGGGTGGSTSVSFPMSVQAQSGSATSNVGTITVTVP